jgi:ABC-type lipoprotein release transport system permease subunit
MKISTMIQLASRNTLRRPARTAFTAGMVTVSVALLLIAISLLGGIFGQILKDGIGSAGDVRIAQSEYVQREETMPLFANLADVDALAKRVEQVEGVRAAEPRIITGVTVTIGLEIGDIFARVVGANERYYLDRLRLKDKLVSGAWFSGQPDELIAGKWVVDQLHAKLGDELVLLGSTQDGSMSSIKGRLVGVAHGTGVEQTIMLPLERAQYLTDMPGAATELLLYGDDYHQAGALAARVRTLPGLQERKVQAWNERDPWQAITATVEGVMGLMIFIIGLLTSLGIWNTMTMTVLERTSELGVLRAMGMSRPRMVLLVLLEAVAISVVGGGVGVTLGAIPAWVLSTRGIHYGSRIAADATIGLSETMYGQFDLTIVTRCFLLGVVMALVGSLIPALRAASIQPVTAMRSGR